ncbi:hypothetical protein ACET3X_002352 [Alternaria dauci]|uniref:Piwi domain-containing protein n=1 Tax=Alternaria dauci TaxID=48095 RepID=A0ABR3UPA4_9PLEO
MVTQDNEDSEPPNLDFRNVFSKEEQKVKFRAAAAASKTQAILVRPDFAQSDGFDDVVFTNHFAIELPTKDLYEYKMQGIITREQAEEDQVPSTARRQELMQQAIDNSSILRSARGTYATDEMEKIIAWVPLPSTNQAGDELQSIQITIQPARQGREAITRDVKLVYVGTVPVAKVVQACSGDIQNLPLEPKGDTGMNAIEAINLIIGHSARNPASDAGVTNFRLGGNKFFSTDNGSEIDLNSGLVCYKGFFFTLRHGMGKPLLNVSSAATAFYKHNICVSDFMKQFCGIGFNSKIRFTDADLRNLKEALKGVRVNIRHENRMRAVTDIAGLDEYPSRLKFVDPTSGTISVADFLDQHRNQPLTQPEIAGIRDSICPCIVFGKSAKASHFPAEVLYIEPYQPLKGRVPPDAAGIMISQAREEPKLNRENISTTGLKLLGFADTPSPVLMASGVSVDRDMITVPIRNTARPLISYSSGNISASNNSKVQWNLGGKKFLETAARGLSTEILLLVPEMFQRRLLNSTTTAEYGHRYVQELIRAFLLYGNGPNETPLRVQDFKINVQRFEVQEGKNCEPEFNQHMATSKAGLAVLLSPTRGGLPDVFADFKRVAETYHGMHSICIAAKAAHDSENSRGAGGSIVNRLPQYMANVAMKLNLKLGNINHSFVLHDTLKQKMFTAVDNQEHGLSVVDTMILGGDVTHPMKGSAGPSIAAIVGSVDDRFAKYPGSVRYQKGSTEIIDDAKDMFEDRLGAWYDKYGRLPSNIIYYRDGVGDSQYVEVLNREVGEIETAFSTIKAKENITSIEKPRITVVIVTKRHHTRFYPRSEVPTKNCEPGTCIESGVTHPVFFDFYLQSHAPMKGTAKPTYYVVLRNDIAFTPAEIQDLTNALCYTYARCCLPVGYAPPAYYADRLCEQARLYIRRTSVREVVGREPQRPDKVQGESADARSMKVRIWKDKVRDWENAVAREWKKQHSGPSTEIVGSDGSKREVRSNGPWHAKLNNTMFWM